MEMKGRRMHMMPTRDRVRQFSIGKIEENTNNVSWNIQSDNLETIKLKLFEYFHKNAFYNQLLTKFIPKDLKVKQLTI